MLEGLLFLREKIKIYFRDVFEFLPRRTLHSTFIILYCMDSYGHSRFAISIEIYHELSEYPWYGSVLPSKNWVICSNVVVECLYLLLCVFLSTSLTRDCPSLSVNKRLHVFNPMLLECLFMIADEILVFLLYVYHRIMGNGEK